MSISVHRPIPINRTSTRTHAWHKRLPRPLGLLLDNLPLNLTTLAPHKRHECQANQQR
jgi:hypothetical protein